MYNLNFEKYKLILGKNIFYKRKAVKLLTDYFLCNEYDLYYLFQKNKFPRRGKITNKILFFFHGLGCTIKNEEEGWSSTLEFGSKGNTLAFDKGTICYILSIHMDECEEFIEELTQNNIIELADEKLYKLLINNPYFDKWSSEEEEIDSTVADRYIFIE